MILWCMNVGSKFYHDYEDYSSKPREEYYGEALVLAWTGVSVGSVKRGVDA